MSLVFSGSCVAFHYQYFKMVGILTHRFEHQTHGLNPHAAPYAHRKEEKKVNGDEKINNSAHRQTNLRKEMISDSAFRLRSSLQEMQKVVNK